jgi:pyruvate/2-oxoglutarate dehydrogenase complex dihydrolipoamide acyltransferase (E2) component
LSIVPLIRGEIIAEVGIESVICDIPSPVNGTIVEILAPEHVVVPTNQADAT